MHLPSRAASIALAVSLAAATALIAGCAPASEAPPVSSRERPAPSALDVELQPMSSERRASELPEGPPREIPVVEGEIVSAGAQGDKVWTYELVADAPTAAVADWYVEAYLGRAWEVADSAAGDGGLVRIVLRKGSGAESDLRFTPEGEGRTRVVGLVGLGVPVSETF